MIWAEMVFKPSKPSFLNEKFLKEMIRIPIFSSSRIYQSWNENDC
jgi:hypothetical protein